MGWGGHQGRSFYIFLTNGESVARTWERISVKASSALLDHLSTRDDLRELIHPQRVDFFLRLVTLCPLGVMGFDCH